MKAFFFEDEYYIRAVPSKNLFKSTLIHEVVNRGDIFAIRVRDNLLTIIPGNSEVIHLEADLFVKYRNNNSELINV